MRAERRVAELLEALRTARLYRVPDGATRETGAGKELWLDTRSNDYLGLAAGFADLEGDGRASLARGTRGGDPPAGLRSRPAGAVGLALPKEAGGGAERELFTGGPAAPPADSPDGGAGPAERGARVASGLREHALESVSRETRPGSASVRVGAGASRLVSGTTDEHVALERELAAWLRAEASLLFSSAYAANVGGLSALALQDDVIFSDELNHASIIDGCRLSRAETVVVPHRDLRALAAALAHPRASRSVRWVVTESYFSMDGTSPDFRALREICDQHDATLIIDETHSLGVFGPQGRGLAAAAGVAPDLLVGGLGKAFGLQGGFIAGPVAFQQWLWNRARSFVFSTGLSPWLCARARSHLRAVEAAEGARSHLAELGVQLERTLRDARVPLPAGRHGPVFPIVLGTETAALAAADHVERLGILAQPIRPPTVPRGSARLRVSLRADMSREQVERLGSALIAAWREQRSDVTSPPAPRTPTEPAPTCESALSWSGHPERGAAPPVAWAGAGSEQPRWVVLGTGTGVGKSYVAASLVQSLAQAGCAVAGLKPVETGCRVSADGKPSEGDAALLEAASAGVKHPRPHPLYGFREPIAPSLAARREGQQVDIAAISSWTDRVRPQSAGAPVLVIETAGGVFSPLSDGATNFELARALGAARWLLVAPDRLGVLHDVTSTLRAMAALGRTPDLLVLSAPAEPDASTGSNAAELRRLSLTVPVLELGRGQPLALAALLDVGLWPAAE